MVQIFNFLSSLLAFLFFTNVITSSPMNFDHKKRDPADGGSWEDYGLSGVNAMHMSVLSSTKVLFIDKVEQNPLKQSDGVLPALLAEFDLTSKGLRAIDVTTDTFCSAGSWLGNDTLISGGGGQPGGPIIDGGNTVRLYDPISGTIYEKVNFMTTYRWYSAMVTLPDGRVMSLGGSKKATGANKPEINSATYEFFPTPDGSKAIPVDLPFLVTSLPFNLYPFVHIVRNDQLKNTAFVFANKKSILLDLDTNTVLTTYPDMPGNSPRSYPLTGTSVMLPLTPATNYTTTIMICGGGTQQIPTAPTEASCGRMNLLDANPVWEMDDFGGQGRVMPDSIILPTGNILFINGGGVGYAGFRRGTTANPLYSSDNPVLAPSLYDVVAKTYKTLTPSTIPRMYHSVASLLTNGKILIAGSNPQPNVDVGTKFPTEYRIELFTPPELLSGKPRPSIQTIAGYAINSVKLLAHYKQSLAVEFNLTVTGFQQSLLKVAIIHLGFVTHSQHMSQKYVELVITSVTPPQTADSNLYTILVDTPPDQTILPPGPSYLTVVYDGVACEDMGQVVLFIQTPQ